MTSDRPSKAVAATREYTEVEGISAVAGENGRVVEDIEYWATLELAPPCCAEWPALNGRCRFCILILTQTVRRVCYE